jgi:hypothetical protein
VPAIGYVYVYIGLNDYAGVFVAWLKTWPLFDPLRGEPRFKQLLARMQFPD